MEIYGIRRGYEGMIDGEFWKMESKDVSNILQLGGTILQTARSDRFTAAKWSGLLGPRDLDSLKPSDFEMVDGGERIALTNDSVRNR